MSHRLTQGREIIRNFPESDVLGTYLLMSDWMARRGDPVLAIRRPQASRNG
jgi:hypothetical protein